MTIQQILDAILGQLGVLVLLLLILWSGWRGYWVFEREVKREREATAKDITRLEGEVKEWKHMAFRGTDLAEFFGEQAAKS